MRVDKWARPSHPAAAGGRVCFVGACQMLPSPCALIAAVIGFLGKGPLEEGQRKTATLCMLILFFKEVRQITACLLLNL